MTPILTNLGRVLNALGKLRDWLKGRRADVALWLAVVASLVNLALLGHPR